MYYSMMMMMTENFLFSFFHFFTTHPNLRTRRQSFDHGGSKRWLLPGNETSPSKSFVERSRRKRVDARSAATRMLCHSTHARKSPAGKKRPNASPHYSTSTTGSARVIHREEAEGYSRAEQNRAALACLLCGLAEESSKGQHSQQTSPPPRSSI